MPAHLVCIGSPENTMDHHHHEYGEERAYDGHNPGPMDEETARWYVENWGDHVSNSMTVEVAGVKPRDVVLDIGCGSGAAVREATTLTTRGRVIGVDPSLAMLDIAGEQTVSAPGRDRIEYLEGSAESIPLDDGSISLALAINSVHHWADLAQGLAEVRRVLGPSGRLIIGEELLASGKFGHGEGPSSDPEFVAQAMRDAGFARVTVGAHSRGTDVVQYIRGYKAETANSEA